MIYSGFIMLSKDYMKQRDFNMKMSMFQKTKSNKKTLQKMPKQNKIKSNELQRNQEAFQNNFCIQLKQKIIICKQDDL